MSRFPFPTTPNGWYQVAYAEDLPGRGVVPLRYFGTDLVMFRDGDGVARVLDAHCPHLGAHLGYGGVVEGPAIRCPFHGWRIDGTGQCVGVAEGQKIPLRAKIRSWPVRERNGMVLVYSHGTSAEPTWEIPSLPEYGSPSFHPYVRRRWVIRTHVLEVAENIADGPHFHDVHKAATIPTTVAEPDGHRLHIVSRMKQLSPRGLFDATIDAVGHGPAWWTLRFSGVVELLFVSAMTPIDSESIEVRFSFLLTTRGDARPDTGLGAAIIRDVEHQMDQDIPIWEHKMYRAQPFMTGLDAPIAAFRKWSRQFVE